MTTPTAERPALSERGFLSRARVPLLVGAGVLATTVALRLRDPHEAGSWGFCPFLALTGWDCPLCGGLRGTNDLAHGNVAAAASSNLLLVLSVPVLVTLWALWMRRSSRTAPPAPLVSGSTAVRWVTAYGVVTVLFTIWRNTPWGAWLQA